MEFGLTAALGRGLVRVSEVMEKFGMWQACIMQSESEAGLGRGLVRVRKVIEKFGMWQACIMQSGSKAGLS